MNESTTYQSYLMLGTTSGSSTTYSKLVDIKDYPDLGGAPERVEITTLSDPIRRYLKGIQDTEDLTFTANYVLADYNTIKALSGQQKFAVYFDDGTASSPTGTLGKFAFEGEIDVLVTGAGVNDPREMQITITPTTEITVVQ